MLFPVHAFLSRSSERVMMLPRPERGRRTNSKTDAQPSTSTEMPPIQRILRLSKGSEGTTTPISDEEFVVLSAAFLVEGFSFGAFTAALEASVLEWPDFVRSSRGAIPALGDGVGGAA